MITRQWIIGRATDCDLVLTSSEVSSRHCRLIRTVDGWVLEDLGSSNGTWVNEQRITSAVRVTPNDRITLGQKTPLPWPREPVAPPPPPPPRLPEKKPQGHAPPVPP